MSYPRIIAAYLANVYCDPPRLDLLYDYDTAIDVLPQRRWLHNWAGIAIVLPGYRIWTTDREIITLDKHKLDVKVKTIA